MNFTFSIFCVRFYIWKLILVKNEFKVKWFMFW
jgi:hypothetical protein